MEKFPKNLPLYRGNDYKNVMGKTDDGRWEMLETPPNPTNLSKKFVKDFVTAKEIFIYYSMYQGIKITLVNGSTKIYFLFLESEQDYRFGQWLKDIELQAVFLYISANGFFDEIPLRFPKKSSTVNKIAYHYHGAYISGISGYPYGFDYTIDYPNLKELEIEGYTYNNDDLDKHFFEFIQKSKIKKITISNNSENYLDKSLLPRDDIIVEDKDRDLSKIQFEGGW